MPALRTSFRGRDRELADLEVLLDQAQLITLTGSGGCGKTRLAVELGRRVVDRFNGGVRLVDFAPLSEPDLVPHMLARSLGIQDSGHGSLIALLAERIAGQRTLLILDNCEHLVAAVASVVDALTLRCPDLVILATTREALGLAGEVRRLVSPLPIEPEAVALFVDRALAVDSSFRLEPTNREIVTAICATLEGIPLAIELAAPWLLLMTPAELLPRLDRRLDPPAATRRDLPDRQRTMRATIDWSHRLLAGPQAILFRRLSTFAGSFSVAAAEEICGWDPLHVRDVLALLSGLCERSLVTIDRPTSQTTRYRLLATLREYGLERLQQAGEERELRRRHLSHYLDRAERIYEERMASGSDAGVVALVSDVAELHAALSWSSEHQPGDALRLAGALESFWMSSAVAEGRHWLRVALASSPARTRYRARALMSLPLIAVQDSWPETRNLMEESVAIWRELGDEQGEAMGLLAFGNAAWFAGDLETARVHLEAALDRLKGLAYGFGVERAMIHLGTVLTNTPGHLDAGRALLADGLSQARELNDDWGQVYALALLGWAELLAGNPQVAAGHLRKALKGRLQGGVTATAVGGLGQLTIPEDHRRALRLLGAAGAIRDRVGVPRFPSSIQQRFEEARANAERRLDPRAAMRAWEEGREMSTQAAIAYALGGPLVPLRPSARTLTERQLEVARLVADGLTNKEIASKLRVSVRTAEKHVDNIFTSLGLRNRTQLAAWLYERREDGRPTYADT
jgi:predicted ATPase/DNA-binding CsgD family transcriptional regulator